MDNSHNNRGHRGNKWGYSNQYYRDANYRPNWNPADHPRHYRGRGGNRWPGSRGRGGKRGYHEMQYYSNPALNINQMPETYGNRDSGWNIECNQHLVPVNANDNRLKSPHKHISPEKIGQSEPVSLLPSSENTVQGPLLNVVTPSIYKPRHIPPYRPPPHFVPHPPYQTMPANHHLEPPTEREPQDLNRHPFKVLPSIRPIDSVGKFVKPSTRTRLEHSPCKRRQINLIKSLGIKARLTIGTTLPTPSQSSYTPNTDTPNTSQNTVLTNTNIGPVTTTQSSTTDLQQSVPRFVVRQLLSLNKTSLQEMVNSPTSRKGAFVMEELKKLHKTWLQKKIDQKRFGNQCERSKDDDDMAAVDLADVPPEIYAQVQSFIELDLHKPVQIEKETNIGIDVIGDCIMIEPPVPDIITLDSDEDDTASDTDTVIAPEHVTSNFSSDRNVQSPAIADSTSDDIIQPVEIQRDNDTPDIQSPFHIMKVTSTPRAIGGNWAKRGQPRSRSSSSPSTSNVLSYLASTTVAEVPSNTIIPDCDSTEPAEDDTVILQQIIDIENQIQVLNSKKQSLYHQIMRKHNLQLPGTMNIYQNMDQSSALPSIQSNLLQNVTSVNETQCVQSSSRIAVVQSMSAENLAVGSVRVRQDLLLVNSTESSDENQVSKQPTNKYAVPSNRKRGPKCTSENNSENSGKELKNNYKSKKRKEGKDVSLSQEATVSEKVPKSSQTPFKKLAKVTKQSPKASVAAVSTPSPSSTLACFASLVRKPYPNACTSIQSTASNSKGTVSTKKGGFEPHLLAVSDIQILSPNFLFTSSFDQSVRCYNYNSGKIMVRYKGHTNKVNCLHIRKSRDYSTDFSLRHVKLYTGSADGDLIRYDPLSPMPVSVVAVNAPIQCIDSCGEHLFLGLNTGEIAVYNVNKNEAVAFRIYCSEQPIVCLKCAIEGKKKIVIVAPLKTYVSIRDATSGALLRSFSNTNALTTNDLQIVGPHVFCGMSNKSVIQRDISTGDLKNTFVVGGMVSSLAASECYIYVACYDGFIYCFRIKDALCMSKFPCGGKFAMSIAVADDKVFTGSPDGQIQVNPAFKSTNTANVQLE